MANESVSDDAGDRGWLDGRNVVFGRVIDGMDAVKYVESVRTGPMDRPIDEVRIFDAGILPQDESHDEL